LQFGFDKFQAVFFAVQKEYFNAPDRHTNLFYGQVFDAAMTLWNAPTEAVHRLGHDCPIFISTQLWLDNERSQKVLC
jgi:hypothetical protein